MLLKTVKNTDARKIAFWLKKNPDRVFDSCNGRCCVVFVCFLFSILSGERRGHTHRDISQDTSRKQFFFVWCPVLSGKRLGEEVLKKRRSLLPHTRRRTWPRSILGAGYFRTIKAIFTKSRFTEFGWTNIAENALETTSRIENYELHWCTARFFHSYITTIFMRNRTYWVFPILQTIVTNLQHKPKVGGKNVKRSFIFL